MPGIQPFPELRFWDLCTVAYIDTMGFDTLPVPRRELQFHSPRSGNFGDMPCRRRIVSRGVFIPEIYYYRRDHLASNRILCAVGWRRTHGIGEGPDVARSVACVLHCLAQLLAPARPE